MRAQQQRGTRLVVQVFRYTRAAFFDLAVSRVATNGGMPLKYTLARQEPLVSIGWPHRIGLIYLGIGCGDLFLKEQPGVC
jgi:hypothetical protein